MYGIEITVSDDKGGDVVPGGAKMDRGMVRAPDIKDGESSFRKGLIEREKLDVKVLHLKKSEPGTLPRRQLSSSHRDTELHHLQNPSRIATLTLLLPY